MLQFTNHDNGFFSIVFVKFHEILKLNASQMIRYH